MCLLIKLKIFCILLFIQFLIHVGKTNPLSTRDKIYSVVIDAGSTGSRVVAYEFERHGNKLKLLREQFNKTRPGLSSYAQNPDEGAKSIMQLIDNIQDFVPAYLKPKTKLFLRATAGLRLLGNDTAKMLLDKVQEEFKKTDYKVEDHAAGMLSGSDEGMFSWFTVNYLKDTLDQSKTYAALEMGGGSAQVTYIPKDNYKNDLKEDIHDVPYNNLQVFSKSYLGLGINAARDAMFREDVKGDFKPGQTVISKCLNPNVEFFKFEFNNTKYLVSGYTKSRKRVKTEQCLAHAKKYVQEKVKPKPLGLSEEQSVALSAFYYRGNAAKLIVGEGGNTTLGEIWKKAEEECAMVHLKDPNDPFLCMDLIYIHTLLKYGFGLKDCNRIEMILKLDNHELSWALGFAYSELVKQYNLSKNIDSENQIEKK
ncbi:ectonucleoside triphosphate diphosphohydrolase 5-like [Ctenocephalides felis]|uniref:ectonucleoside triphosphate diphosphohydrolase 5-like n=1 Tax=Ctenocephalides felis TaxID=7515 RepID=UPI000E6E37C3|nr:ectonucleoside triphosphate diphosphohydrolase 5-like [Ctenocephalides felis]